MIANVTLTGEPVLDVLLNFGLPGAAMILLYLGLTKKNKSGSNETKTMVHIVKSLEAIEKRLSHIEDKEDARESVRERHLAVFESLTSSIAKQQERMTDTQQAMLRVMERQLAILENVDRGVRISDDKIDMLKSDIQVLKETGVCKVSEAVVKATVKHPN